MPCPPPHPSSPRCRAAPRGGLALLLAAVLGLAGPAGAATLAVDTFDQDGPGCTLASAILSANQDQDEGGCVAAGTYGADTIVLQKGTYALAHAHGGGEDGLPIIADTLTIRGNGATIARTAGSAPFRILHVIAGDLVLTDLTLAGGRVEALTALGGGLLAEAAGGSITLDGCALVGNQAIATDDQAPEFADARGGGVYAGGAALVELLRSRFSANQAVADGVPLGGVALGGGLALTDVGALRITRTLFEGNQAQGRGTEGGGFAGGGAIHFLAESFTESPALIEVTASEIVGNSADASATAAADSTGGASIGGGGLFEGVHLPVLSVIATAVRQNRVTADAAFASSAEAGGLGFYFSAGCGGLVVTGSTIDGNSASASGTEQGGFAAGGGLSAILPEAASLAVTDSSITNNLVQAAGAEGFVLGGGIDLFSYDDAGLTLTSATVGNNRAEAAGAGGGGISFASAGALQLLNATISGNAAVGPAFSAGGGILVDDPAGVLRPQNSLLAGNTATEGPDCDGAVGSLGNNLVGSTASCPGFADGETGKTAGLGALRASARPGAGYFPLLDGSDAVNAGNPSSCPVTDQVGQPRPDTCDIGAVEKVPQTLLVFSVLPNSRAGAPGDPLTAFVTAINAGGAPAYRVGIDSIAPLVPGSALANPVSATLAYQTTSSATNALEGAPDTPVDIPAGGLQSWVIAITPTAPFDPVQLEIGVGAPNAAPIAPIPGVNTLLVSAAEPRPADVVALAATAGNTGIVDVGGSGGAFAVATVNLGAGGPIAVFTNTGSAALPLAIAICQTDPGAGACVGNPGASVTVPIATGATPTFAVFAAAAGAIPFDPAINRIFVTFADAGGVVRGGTSVAVRTVP